MRLLDILAQRALEGRTTFQGLDISIENGKGSTREGVDKKTGEPWKTVMKNPYGYIRRTEGVDGDHIDVYLGPNQNAKNAYVVHQKDPHTGKFDEDKTFLGFDSAEDAKKCFFAHYDEPEKFFGPMETIPMPLFKEKVLGTAKRPAKIAAAGWKLGSVLNLWGNK